jgi:hypothetical protein
VVAGQCATFGRLYRTVRPLPPSSRGAQTVGGEELETGMGDSFGWRATRAHQLRRVPVRLGGIALLLALALAGCAGEADDSPADEGTQESQALEATTPTPSLPPLLGDIVWTTGVDAGTNAPHEAVQQFPATVDALYAVAPIERLPAGTRLTAVWRIDDVTIEGVDTTVEATAEQRDGWVEFHLNRPAEDVFPPGTYSISIEAAGETLATASVEVLVERAGA